MTAAVCTAVSRGLLDLKAFDNSGRWWLGASVALASAGYTASSSDADLIALWKELHKAGRV